MDTPLPVVIEAPMGTETIVVHSDGKVERIPITNNQIDWKAFEEAVLKINKLRDREGVFVTRDVARARRNYSKFKDESNENSCD